MPIIEKNNLQPSIFFLILVNLIPAFGVLFWGWDGYVIFILYWLETAVIGFYNILKMQKIAKLHPQGIIYPFFPKTGLKTVKGIAIVIFIVHFSVFMIGHLIFINIFIKPDLANPFDFISGLIVIWKYWSSIFISLAFIFASHGFSFIFNFIKKEEYKKVNLYNQMFVPYRRVLVMHLAIMIIGALARTLDKGESTLAVLALVVVKIVMDLRAHIAEHKLKKVF